MTAVYLLNLELDTDVHTFFEMCGIYSSEEKARQAILTLKEEPEIKQAIADARGKLDFSIEPYDLGETRWEEGFATEPHRVLRNGQWVLRDEQ